MFIYGIHEPGSDTIMYVGQTRKKIEDRLYEHKWYALKKAGQLPLSIWLRKHPDAEVKLLQTCGSQDELNEAEVEHIWQQRLDHNILNVLDGGGGSVGRPITEEFRRRMSEISKGRPMSDENREAMRQRMTGRKLDPETRAKIAAANTGRVLSVQARAKIAEAARRQVRPPTSDQVKAKLSASTKAWREARRQRTPDVCVDCGGEMLRRRCPARDGYKRHRRFA